jgi:hypothetical protein
MSFIILNELVLKAFPASATGIPLAIVVCKI